MRPRPVKNGRDIRRGVRAIGWPDLIAIPIAAISIGSYVVALRSPPMRPFLIQSS